jgi:hypothetical protein
MTDGYIAPDNGLCFLISAMNNATVLYVHLISDPDTVHIAAYYRIEPNTAIITDHYITDNGGVGGDINVFTKTRRNAFNGKNNWHDDVFAVTLS